MSKIVKPIVDQNKKPYAAPKLLTHGDVAKLTQKHKGVSFPDPTSGLTF